MCAQRILRSAWASAQSDQSLRCALRTQGFCMRTAKTLIRLGGCPGWSESSLGAQPHIRLVLWWGGSLYYMYSYSINTVMVCFVGARSKTGQKEMLTIFVYFNCWYTCTAYVDPREAFMRKKLKQINPSKLHSWLRLLLLALPGLFCLPFYWEYTKPKGDKLYYEKSLREIVEDQCVWLSMGCILNCRLF